MSYSVRKRKTLKGGLLMLLVTMLIVYASRQTTVTLIYVLETEYDYHGCRSAIKLICYL